MKKKGIIVPALLAGTMLVGPAFAQNQPTSATAAATPASDTTADIIVTAQKRSESLQRVPIAVTATSGETLQLRGITDTMKLQYITPGLQVNTTGASSAFYLRGVGTRLTAAGLESSVATYVDDRYVSRSDGAIFGNPDIDRVEVLKGPQGTLYGRNASGGAIRVITHDVTANDEGFVSASFGNYNYLRFSGVANFAVSDTFGVRVYGQTENRDAIANNIAPGGIPPKGLNDLDNQIIGLKTKWEPRSGVIFRLSATYVKKDESPGYATVNLSPVVSINGVPTSLSTYINAGGISGNSPTTVSTALTQKSQGHEWSLEGSGEVDLGFATAKAITTYDNFKYLFGLDSDATNLRKADVIVPETSKAFSEEVQLASNGNDSRLKWIVGGFYWHDTATYFVNIDAGLNNPNGSIKYLTTGLQRVGTTALAVFGQATYSFSDHLDLTVGGRESYERKRVLLTDPTNDSSIFGPDPGVMLTPGVTKANPYRDRVSFTNFTPKATLTYHINRDDMIYATYSKGFKSGGFNEPAIAAPVLKPEKLTMYEVGAKGSFFDRKLRFDLSAYYYDFKDLQVSRSSGTQSTVENAANAHIKGIDLNVDWQVAHPLLVSGGLNVLHGIYKSYLAAPYYVNRTGRDPVTNVPVGAIVPGFVVGPFNADGQDLIRAPKFSAFISGLYTVDAGSGTVPISLTYSYKSSFNFDLIPEPLMQVLRQKGYGLLNGRISYVPTSKRWSIAFWANNITNVRYFLDKSAGAGTIRAIYGDPRTFGGDIRYNF